MLLATQDVPLPKDRSAYRWQPPVRDLEVAQRSRREELRSLLETAAHHAQQAYNAECLLIDRSGDADTVLIKAFLTHRGLVDLWELDIVLWDEVRWAALTVVAEDDVVVVRPNVAAA